MGRFWTAMENALASQSGALFPWLAVLLGAGVGFYFSLPVEPAPWALAGLGIAGAAGVVLAARSGLLAAALLFCVAMPALGVGIAGLRAQIVATPLIEGRYYGPIEGRIVALDRSASDKPRLTLDRVVLPWLPPEKTPRRVRLSLHGDQRWLDPVPGATVILTGHLSAPQGPVEPGGFDFRRHAWFQSLGEVGYTRSPVLQLRDGDGALPVALLRHRLGGRIRDTLGGDRGAVAAAILVGDRSGITPGALTALREANLAHLLAISGLHMGLVAGLVFAGLRLCLVALPGIGLRWPVKKIAAFGALVAAAAYLALSGGNVATQRAFVMVSVMLVAVLIDRRSLSLRSVALAALIVLCLTPEALLGPGFQMSFAATTALVGAFAAWRNRGFEGRLPGWARGAAAVVLSSAVAGAATAPFAMAHFNIVSHFGLVANLLAVPLMGVLVMPAGLLALAAMPLGLEALPLWVMGAGLDWILGVARTVSDLPGAVGQIKAPPTSVLPLVAAAGLIFILWRRRGRYAAALPALAAVAMWGLSDRPDILIARDGALVGVMTAEGRALSKARGAGFTARLWVENDGERISQENAADRWAALEGRIVHLSRKSDLAGFGGCDAQMLVISVYPLEDGSGCTIIGPAELSRNGSMAITRSEAGLRITTARALAGQRPWSETWPADAPRTIAQRGVP
ncbi:competence protein ComEC [Roseivivax lentus]|uniref:Competence protein ComEC n=1 Tax=Roseivivax lentus TaxID=633194 RepID=A0A1N7N7P6_9RHOB|nr:ComEC/Rec2 family competence protein [Roseivivax lentus]SIS94201.1 competence protein ComEC [Roseivivax lentus]